MSPYIRKSRNKTAVPTATGQAGPSLGVVMLPWLMLCSLRAAADGCFPRHNKRSVVSSSNWLLACKWPFLVSWWPVLSVDGVARRRSGVRPLPCPRQTRPAPRSAVSAPWKHWKHFLLLPAGRRCSPPAIPPCLQEPRDVPGPGPLISAPGIGTPAMRGLGTPLKYKLHL